MQVMMLIELSLKRSKPLQSWIHRLTLQRQYPEYTFMHATKRLFPAEAFQAFNAQGKLA